MITYSVESDGDRRKLGLPSRVTFQDKPSTEAEHQFNGTLELRGQKQEACVKIMAKLKVKHMWRKDRLHSQDREQPSDDSAQNIHVPFIYDRFRFAQDNIRDKMRSIPFEVSAEIVGTKRNKPRSGLPQLMPILDSSQLSKDVMTVNIHENTSN